MVKVYHTLSEMSTEFRQKPIGFTFDTNLRIGRIVSCKQETILSFGTDKEINDKLFFAL